jgi:hypothetical protein
MATDMRPLVGHSFTFRQEPTPWWDGMVHCEVLELELHKRLRYAWRTGGPEASRLDTVVTWTLTPTPSGGTRLLLEHSGFPARQHLRLRRRSQGMAAHGGRAPAGRVGEGPLKRRPFWLHRTTSGARAQRSSNVSRPTVPWTRKPAAPSASSARPSKVIARLKRASAMAARKLPSAGQSEVSQGIRFPK